MPLKGLFMNILFFVPVPVSLREAALRRCGILVNFVLSNTLLTFNQLL